MSILGIKIKVTGEVVYCDIDGNDVEYTVEDFNKHASYGVDGKFEEIIDDLGSHFIKIPKAYYATVYNEDNEKMEFISDKEEKINDIEFKAICEPFLISSYRISSHDCNMNKRDYLQSIPMTATDNNKTIEEILKDKPSEKYLIPQDYHYYDIFQRIKIETKNNRNENVCLYLVDANGIISNDASNNNDIDKKRLCSYYRGLYSIGFSHKQYKNKGELFLLNKDIINKLLLTEVDWKQKTDIENEDMTQVLSNITYEHEYGVVLFFNCFNMYDFFIYNKEYTTPLFTYRFVKNV